MSPPKNYPKRLIEVDLPIKRISGHARREKSIRQGHISTIHMWWARRPLAACRAVICAALWPDPADSQCPAEFIKRARAQMQKWTPHERQQLLGEESRKRFERARKDPTLFNDVEELRGALLDFIADFANWDNSTVREYLESSRVLTQAAHEALGGAPGTRPLVVDPFAGGGAIPLEALRVGADTFASDLNPVSVLLNKVVLEYIPKYGQRLADEVCRLGEKIQDEVGALLAQYYPVSAKGNVPVAYLWSRTVISEGPSSDAFPVEVPLLRSMWLAKASSQDRALRWSRDATGNISTEVVDVTYADGTKLTVRRPLLEIFVPVKSSEVGPGTVARGSATCPLTGYTTAVSSVRKQLKTRAGGAADARLIAIRESNPKTNDRLYRAPTPNDDHAAYAAKEAIEANEGMTERGRSLLPNESLPPPGGLGFRVQPYGIVQWKHLFAPRQQLALATLTQSIGRVGIQLAQETDRDFAVAVQSCLSLALGRLTDFCSSLCTLNATGNRGVGHTFTRQILSMVWDFMETAPLNRLGANWMGGIETLNDTIRLQAAVAHCGQVQMASATQLPLPDDIASAVVTDPPYYDAVPYSDLSDYFYVWLKRTLPSEQAFESELTPKAEECILDEAKGKDRAFFESQMAKAMHEARRVLREDGIAVVVFAHKSTAGWEAQLQAMVDAGWIITASWPIDTERPGRLRAQGSAALQSSVHLVCRPRESAGGSARADEIGDWRDVLLELPRRIHEWMPRLAAEGVVGADAIFACLGPALEVFSRYSSVEKASGETVSLREYLEQVWASVSKEALAMIFSGADATGFEEDARLTAMWLWTLTTATSYSGDANAVEGDEPGEDEEDETTRAKNKVGGFVLEYDAARKIAQGLGAHLEQLGSLIEVKGSTARLLPVAERTRSLFQKGDVTEPVGLRNPKKRSAQLSLGFVADLEEAEATGGWGDTGAPHKGETVLDRVHQSMILFGAGRGEALKRFLVDDGAGRDDHFWRLAQALSALYPSSTDEKRWVDGVLARKKSLGF